jgi:hypothetical protein
VASPASCALPRAARSVAFKRPRWSQSLAKLVSRLTCGLGRGRRLTSTSRLLQETVLDGLLVCARGFPIGTIPEQSFRINRLIAGSFQVPFWPAASVLSILDFALASCFAPTVPRRVSLEVALEIRTANHKLDGSWSCGPILADSSVADPVGLFREPVAIRVRRLPGSRHDIPWELS